MEKLALRFNVPLISHCADSPANALSALIKVNSPKSFITLLPEVQFIGLPLSGFCFFAPFFRTYPSIAYPCWDHSSRTVLRHLMNKNIVIVSGIVSNQGDGLQLYQMSSITDLHTLKNRYRNSSVRHFDINKQISKKVYTVMIRASSCSDQPRCVPQCREATFVDT